MTHEEIIMLVLGLVATFVVITLLGPFLRSIIWSLFSFDKEVQKVKSEQKRSEVKLGRISETLAPFLDTFPVDVEKPGTTTVFLGQPVDYVHFDPDEGIVFIEVKSGDAKLTKTQRALRDRIKEGKVLWKEVRIRGEAEEEE
jgi:predicted Holliday junction resolvase-like endonuclease